MKNSKKLIGLSLSALVFLTSFSVANAGVVTDYNYNNQYNSYSVNTNKSVSSSNLTNPSESSATQISDTSLTNQTTTVYNNNNQNTSYTISNSSYNTSNSYVLPKSEVQTKPTTNSGTSSTVSSDNTNNITQESIGIGENEKKLADMINQERKKAGLKPLLIDEKLFVIAETKSQDMYDNTYFSHSSPIFGSTSSLIRKESISYRYFGENIGRTYSIYSAHSGFMKSEGHRKNILNPNFTHIGIGIVGNYYTEVFIGK